MVIQKTDGNRATNESAERLRAILEAAIDAIITIDEAGIVQSANRATQNLFGYPPDELIGHNVAMLMPSPHREAHDGYLARYLATGERKIIGLGREIEGRRKDGTTFPIDLIVTEAQLANRKVFIGTVRDITDRKEAEHWATSVGQIIENSLNEIYIIHAGTKKFVQVNRGARENIGYTMDELRALTPLDLAPSITPEELDRKLEPLTSGEQERIVFTSAHRRKDGTEYDVEVHLQRAHYQGTPVFVAMILDTTERRKAEALVRLQQQELRQLNDELEDRVRLRTSELVAALEELVRTEKLATLGQLAGSVAHEIRNPLGVIKNAAYFLETNSTDLDAERRAAFDEINRALSTSNRIVSELLDYARDPRREVTEFAAGDVVEQACALARVPDSVSVIHQREGAGRLLRADFGQIERILLNLVQNAVQAMPAGGNLTVRCSDLAGNKSAIEVEDTGHGISPDDLDRVFEPLFSGRTKGVGLGLALSRRYAELNQGTLSVKSEVGRGATFRLTLPSGRQSQKEMEARP